MSQIATLNDAELFQFAVSGTEIFINRANRLYADRLRAPLAMPWVLLDIRGAAAGRAHLLSNEIHYNPALMRHNVVAFLERTIPHEVAHLVTFSVWGRQAKAHGLEWQSVMARFGADATRCHSYDTSVLESRKHRLHCLCMEHPVSVRRYNAVCRGASYRCRKCGHVLTARAPAPRTA